MHDISVPDVPIVPFSIAQAVHSIAGSSFQDSNVQGCLGHLWFSVQASGGGGTMDRPVSVSTIEPSAGQYIKQTVHFGYVQRSSISKKCWEVGETTTALMLISRQTT